MISAARVAVLVAAASAAVLTAGAAVEPATAQGDACKTELVTATGRGKFRPFTRTKELEGGGASMKDAVAAWEREVESTHGERFKLWSEAKDKTFDCNITQGKILSNLVQCTISGRPCAAAEESEPSAPPIAAGPSRGRVGRVDRRDDEHHDGSPYMGRGWRYRREMARQLAIARWRERREERAWDREGARQRYYQRSRDRAEERGWARVEARERWLARQRD